jgi:hypothetical protein
MITFNATKMNNKILQMNDDNISKLGDLGLNGITKHTEGTPYSDMKLHFLPSTSSTTTH